MVDVDNGNRLTTYAIEGERGTGIVCINGAAARLISPGDTVIIIAYAAWTTTRRGPSNPRSSSSTRTTGSSRSATTAGDVPEASA